MDGEALPMMLAENEAMIVRARASANELREDVERSKRLVSNSAMLLRACRQDGRYADFATDRDEAAAL